MTTHSLENSVRIMKMIRDTRNSQLDTSILEELDKAIIDLEKHMDEKDAERDKERRFRALQVLGTIIRIITDIDEWMK